MSNNEQLKQAIVDSVEHGTYPEPDVSSTEVPSTLLPALLADLQKARDDVKVSCCKHLVCSSYLMDHV
jgi:centromere/kinetochore protein ZW10